MLVDADALHDALDKMDDAELDDLSFGVIRMNLDGLVTYYNAFEANAAGMTPGRVVGRHFFSEVAPCTNNFMISQRFVDNEDLDEELDYVFTLRMRPTPVRLRLLKRTDSGTQYVIVTRT